MANVKVSLYQSIKVAGSWTLQRAPEQRLRRLSQGGYYIRFGNSMEAAGRDPAVALASLRRKQAELRFVASGGEVRPDENTTDQPKRVTLAEAVKEYIADCRDRQGKVGVRPCSANCRGIRVPAGLPDQLPAQRLPRRSRPGFRPRLPAKPSRTSRRSERPLLLQRHAGGQHVPDPQ